MFIYKYTHSLSSSLCLVWHKIYQHFVLWVPLKFIFTSKRCLVPSYVFFFSAQYTKSYRDNYWNNNKHPKRYLSVTKPHIFVASNDGNKTATSSWDPDPPRANVVLPYLFSDLKYPNIYLINSSNEVALSVFSCLFLFL